MSVIACEVVKSILMDKKPSIRLDESRELLFSIIPEFKESYGFDQQNNHHIYDVYNHTLKVVDNVPAILNLRIAALYHDMGKPFTFRLDENGIGQFDGHEIVSMDIFDNHSSDFNISKEDVELIRKLILHHDLKPTRDQEICILNSEFGKDINLLFSLKKANILGGNPAYHNEESGKILRLESRCRRI